jgi:hypothetical protein
VSARTTPPEPERSWREKWGLGVGAEFPPDHVAGWNRRDSGGVCDSESGRERKRVRVKERERGRGQRDVLV